MSYAGGTVAGMSALTRNGLLDPQTPSDYLFLVLIVCSGPGAVVLLWLYFQDWRARRATSGSQGSPGRSSGQVRLASSAFGTGGTGIGWIGQELLACKKTAEFRIHQSQLV